MKTRYAQRGSTLIELSVIIAVIFVLISVLIVGVTAWRNGASRSSHIVNQSSVPQGN